MPVQEFDEYLEECGLEELYQGLQQSPQTEHLYASKLQSVKDRLEDIYRKDPEEFYHRKKLIQQAIKEREKGQTKKMPELTLDELHELLKFTGRLYR